jgi:hypothetical protein
MSMSEQKYKYTGAPVLSLLGIAFVVLKLCGTISWSWLWVLAPFWAPLVLIVLIVFGCLAISAVAFLASEFLTNRKPRR